MMLVQYKRIKDGYLITGRFGGSSEERIGWAAKGDKWWQAVDTFMQHSRTFATRRAAVSWLVHLAEERKDEIWEKRHG